MPTASPRSPRSAAATVALALAAALTIAVATALALIALTIVARPARGQDGPVASGEPKVPETLPSPGAPKPPGAVATCMTAGCHDDLATERYVHGPVAVGRCDGCHVSEGDAAPTDMENHRFRLARSERELCYKCHERRMDSQAVVHGPVRFGLCTACHDPHQSPYRYRLKTEKSVDLCLRCHIDHMTTEKEVHGPVAAGACVACHDPHTSPHEYRLIAARTDLCYTCHTEKKEDFASKRFGHPPAKHDCNNCHNPHTSPWPYRTHRPVPDLCFGCHADKRDHVMEVATEHDAYKIEKKCLNCHDPHYTDLPKQLKAPPMDLCFQCHDREQMTPTGKVQNMKAHLEEFPDWHGPIRQRDCAACHDPHGSENFRLLKRTYPRDFYTPFAEEKYGLCFGCHERTLALERFTTTLTGFRNFNESLHFRHVNRAEKGRTCRACHDIHASKRPKHIRESVPFGEWELPTNFVKYENGGKCWPGCHVPRGYSRVRRVENPIDYETFKGE